MQPLTNEIVRNREKIHQYGTEQHALERALDRHASVLKTVLNECSSYLTADGPTMRFTCEDLQQEVFHWKMPQGGAFIVHTPHWRADANAYLFDDKSGRYLLEDLYGELCFLFLRNGRFTPPQTGHLATSSLTLHTVRILERQGLDLRSQIEIGRTFMREIRQIVLRHLERTILNAVYDANLASERQRPRERTFWEWLLRRDPPTPERILPFAGREDDPLIVSLQHGFERAWARRREKYRRQGPDIGFSSPGESYIQLVTLLIGFILTDRTHPTDVAGKLRRTLDLWHSGEQAVGLNTGDNVIIVSVRRG